MSAQVQEILGLAPRLVRRARERAPAAPAQRLDDGPERGTGHQPHPPPHHLRPQSDALSDLYQIQGGRESNGLVVLSV